MGQAKIRRQIDPLYGSANGYTISIYSADKALVAEIDIAVKWCGDLRRSNRRAIAITGLLANWLSNQTSLPARMDLQEAIGFTKWMQLKSFVAANPINRFHLRLTGTAIEQENIEAGRDIDDCPEFSTEPIDGINYQLDPVVLSRLAK